MIRAALYQGPDGQYTGYDLRGHAGYAEEGSDIVCAAASILSINCLNSLESVCGVKAQVEGGQDGRLRVTLPQGMTLTQAHDAQVLLSALRQGMSDLAQDYPQHVHFSILKRRETP